MSTPSVTRLKPIPRLHPLTCTVQLPNPELYEMQPAKPYPVQPSTLTPDQERRLDAQWVLEELRKEWGAQRVRRWLDTMDLRDGLIDVDPRRI